MTIRARGANALMAFAFGSTYDTPPDADSYFGIPFVTSALGAERPLQADDLLGQGREEQDPDDDVITADGDISVPVDVRNFGLHLKALMGAPTTTAKDKAIGSWDFSDQPTAATGSITVNGTPFTFVTSGATGNQIALGVDLAATLAAAVTALNTSVVTGVALATYSTSGTKLIATVDLAGLAGNAFTLAANAASNSTPSGATAAGGTVKHTFTSGATEIPAAFIEVQRPDISQFKMNRQVRAGTHKIALTRKGKLNCVVSNVAKGEDEADVSLAGDLTVMEVVRFSQCFGEVTRNGVTFGGVVSANVSYDNSLEPVEVIRPDSEIDDADPGSAKASGDVTVRLSDQNKSIPTGAQNPSNLTFGWTRPGTNFSLKYTVPRAFLPRVKDSITGAGGSQKTYSFQASKDPTLGYSMLVELVNDVANYNNPD